MKHCALAFTFVCLLSAPAFAETYTYAPDDCEFQVTFPEKPFVEQKCDPADKSKCDDVLTYMQTADASSVNFRIVCAKDDTKKLSAIKPEELKATTEQMVKEAGLKSFAGDAATIDGAKTAVSMAAGKRNNRDIIYTGQIWIGQNSMLTMEGEMRGPENKKINELYSQILKSIKLKSAPKAAPKKP